MSTRTAKVNLPGDFAAFTPPLKQSWMDRALCVGLDPEMFFPHDGGRSSQDVAIAKAICADCPVTADCALYGREDAHGVFGGLSVQERTKLRGRRTDGRNMNEYVGRRAS